MVIACLRDFRALQKFVVICKSEQGRKPPRIADKVAVTAFINGWCPANNIVYERAKRVAEELGTDVVFESVHTTEQSAMITCGYSDCVFVDGKTVQKGPPPSYDRIYKIMAKRVKKLSH